MTKNILSPVEHGEPLDRLALDQIALVLGRDIHHSSWEKHQVKSGGDYADEAKVDYG